MEQKAAGAEFAPGGRGAYKREVSGSIPAVDRAGISNQSGKPDAEPGISLEAASQRNNRIPQVIRSDRIMEGVERDTLKTSAGARLAMGSRYANAGVYNK